MQLNHRIPFLLIIVLELITAKHPRTILYNNGEIISLSSILGTRLVFNTNPLNGLLNNGTPKTIVWYRSIIDSKSSLFNPSTVGDANNLSINLTATTSSRYSLVNRTKLVINQTQIGDEGFYKLQIETESNTLKQYLYHVTLLSRNLMISISPTSDKKTTYHAEQQINFTCSISFFVDRTLAERARSLFLSTWDMIIYNHDPDHYQLLSLSVTTYAYTAHLFNYELHRSDHNQIVSCALIERQSSRAVVLNTSLKDPLNIEYKASLVGHYYFARAFNAYSTIEINCEEFEANPKPVYTLVWILNGNNQTLLNKTMHGKYVINNATWRNRGNYTCFAENHLNYQQPAHQSFRLNVWFDEHQSQLKNLPRISRSRQLSPPHPRTLITLILLTVVFVFVCLFFIFSLYYFCLQTK